MFLGKIRVTETLRGKGNCLGFKSSFLAKDLAVIDKCQLSQTRFNMKQNLTNIR
jgi:hypothetical protein